MSKQLQLLFAFFSLFVTATLFAENLYIPVAGRVNGANGTFWRTDVRIFNPSTVDDISVSVHFLPQGLDGSNIPGRLVAVPKRQMVVLDDIVGSFFGQQGLGALRLDSDTDKSYSFTAESRTYTDATNGATFGQFIPALDPDDDAHTESVVTHVSHDAEFRTNAGVMNANRIAANVKAFLVAPDGTLLTPEVTFTVPPQSMIQKDVPSLFDTTRVVDDGFILFKSDVPVLTWASVVDNRSGDAICVLGAEDKAEVTPLP